MARQVACIPQHTACCYASDPARIGHDKPTESQAVSAHVRREIHRRGLVDCCILSLVQEGLLGTVRRWPRGDRNTGGGGDQPLLSEDRLPCAAIAVRDQELRDTYLHAWSKVGA